MVAGDAATVGLRPFGADRVGPGVVRVPQSVASPSVSASASASPAPSPLVDQDACPLPQSRFACDLQTRIKRAVDYLADRPGKTGLVVADRKTGAVWRNEYAGREVFTASTSKLGIAVDLLTRDRAGDIALSADDRRTLDAMLRRSDDDAANTLWSKYGEDDIVGRFPSYGAPAAAFVPGLARKWGSMTCTPNDLAGLMLHVLEKMPADLRGSILAPLRAVAPNQQWGVWAAGPALRPGNKNGWFGYSTGYVVNSVGFLGDDGRYVVALMSDGADEGDYDTGVTTTSRAAEILLGGYPAR